jgi:glycine cleavage system H protein
MSLLFAVLTLAIFIILGWLSRGRGKMMAATPVLVKRYIHPGHTWVRETEDGDVLIGIDDFAQSVFGSIDGVELPRILKKINQGTIGWNVRHGQRTIPMLSPVSGRVIEKNEMVLNDPSLVNASPYADGWLLRVRPRRLPAQLTNLLSGKPAQQWLDGVRAELGRFFSGTPVLMYQDGGFMMTDLADRCSEEEWKRLVKEFFLVDEPTKRS